jgi:hypothetical protein
MSKLQSVNPFGKNPCISYDVRANFTIRNKIWKIFQKSINCREIMRLLRNIFIAEKRIQDWKSYSSFHLHFQCWVIENVFDVMIEHGLADLKEHMDALEKHMKSTTFSKMKFEVTDDVHSKVRAMLDTQDSVETQKSIQQSVLSLIKLKMCLV